MKYKLAVVFFYVFCCSYAGQKVTISGNDTSYCGVEIVFNKFSDPISGSETILGSALVDTSGNFTISFELDEITFVFSLTGVYRMHLYAIPGSAYEIILPPRQDKETVDFLNPYFSPVTVHLGITDHDQNELNMLIRMFNDAFIPYYNKHIMLLAEKSDFSQLDKDIQSMEKSFAGSNNEFFNDYRRYRHGLLRHLAFQQRSKSISNEYFRKQPVLLNNPAYTELFNQVYDKYLFHLSRTPAGSIIGQAVKSERIDSLRMIFSDDGVLGPGDLPEIVLLKCLHDEFYNDNYSRSSLLAMLDEFIAENRNSALTAIAVSVRYKVTKLLAGFTPPAFELYNRDSVLIGLDNFKGKYIYLNFCSCFSYSCLNEFKMLEVLYKKHGNILEIVTVLVDNDYDVVNSFLERSNYQWTFLHYGHQSSIIRDYDIRGFPIYYLIDREGKLVMSPAPSPGEEFEARFFKLMRSRREL